MKKAALDIAKGAYQVWIGDDIDTLIDPDANFLEKTWSGISLASNFIPGAAVGKLGLKVGGKTLKIKIKFEKMMAKKFPNAFWRGHYANTAEKLSGKVI